MTGRRVDDRPELRSFVDRVVLWQRGVADASEVVDVATLALLAGVEAPAFVLVAGLTGREATTELGEVLPTALAELEVGLPANDEPEHDLLCVAALGRSAKADAVGIRELTRRVHRLFGHRSHPLVEALSLLDDDFDALELVGHGDPDEIVARAHHALTAVHARADEILAAS